jgi:hypothetical protein
MPSHNGFAACGSAHNPSFLAIDRSDCVDIDECAGNGLGDRLRNAASPWRYFLRRKQLSCQQI